MSVDPPPTTVVVLQHLVASTTSMSALELARQFGSQKSAINKVLYELLKRGQAHFQTTTPPLWSATAASVANNYQSEEETLLRTIQECGEHGASTFSIALKLQKSINLVNQMLYALRDDKKVEKVNESPPAWKLREKEESPTGDLKKRGYLASDESQSAKSRAKRPRQDPASAVAHHFVETTKADKNWAKKCAEAVWEKYKEHQSNEGKKKDAHAIVAGFLLREPGDKTPRLVALGSGTSIASGDHYSMRGYVVHDSHAEIVARRGLLRWLYRQLEAASKGEESIAIRKEPNSGNQPYALKPFDLYLYISQAPCGDGAVFSRADLKITGAQKSTQHANEGQLRMKTEAGTGTTAARAHETHLEVTFDGLQRGDRALCQSCSDKIAKWNVLGVQGALLSRLMPPLYLSGLVIGELFHHHHLVRACVAGTRELFVALVSVSLCQSLSSCATQRC